MAYQILLAEDDEVSQDIVRAYLDGGVDWEMIVANDGRQALQIALDRRFDLMIFDQNMPHINGDRVIRHLRAGRSLNARTPVIRFTADANMRLAEIRHVDGVAEATLPKPLRRALFISTIRTLLGIG